MSARLLASVQSLKAQTAALIRCLDINADPDLIPATDGLEDVYRLVTDLEATIRAIDHRDAFLDGVAAAVGLGPEE